MSFQPDPLQVLFLWRLLASNGEHWWKTVKPQPSVKQRKQLERECLIEVERRRSGKRGTGFYVTLTDKGWAWAGEHLDAVVSTRSPAAGPVLQDILTKLKGYLTESGVPLVEVLGPKPPALPIADRLRAACLSLSGGRTHTRVRLAELRAALPDVPVQQFDETVLALGDRGLLALYPLENPRELTDADRQAAISIGGQDNHVIYLED